MAAAPWLLALVGLVVALVWTELRAWPIVLAWVLILAALRLVRPLRGVSRGVGIILAVASLPLMSVLVSLMGLYLVPAILAWLLLELVPRCPPGTCRARGSRGDR